MLLFYLVILLSNAVFLLKRRDKSILYIRRTIGKNAFKVESTPHTIKNNLALPLQSSIINLAFFKSCFSKKGLILVFLNFITAQLLMIIWFLSFNNSP